MFKTTVTQKGQVTIPQEYREGMDLDTGSVLVVEMKEDKIILEKPKTPLSELKGSCKWFTKDIEEEIRKLWGTWDAKALLGHRHYN